MKKICLLTLLALGLTGLASAANDNTWVTPQPAKDYLYATNTMASNEFFDLSTAYTENNGEITLNAAAQTYGIQNIMVLGKDLTDGTALNNLFFGYDNGAWVTATRTGDNSKTTTFPLQNLVQNASCGFMEKTVTGLILSAAGGVYLTDATGGDVEMTLPDPLASLKDVQYAARGFIAKYSNDAAGNYAAVMDAVPITKMEGKPVCHIALGQDNMSGLKYILVQYNLLVNNHTLVYQIQMGDDGRVEYRVGKQDKTTQTPADNDYYTFRIDLKRNADALSFGGAQTFLIAPVQTESDKTGWVCNTSQSLEKRRLSIYPKNGTITGVSSYTSIDATMVLSAKSQEVAGNVSSLLVIASPKTSVSPVFANKAYKVGDNVEDGNDFRVAGFPVVYSGKPANLADISFTAYGLTPNEKYYLYAYLCKQDGTNYRYSTEVFVSSDGLTTKPMETPGDITAGEPEGDIIPLTFEASPFKLLVMKSTTAASNVPQGNLKAGDTYGEGTVVAILDKGVTSYNIPMAPGEMTYVQMYAMTDDATPGYSSNFSLLPLYRQATSLPLSYTFSIKDLITNQPDNAMPILPPGLGTSTAFDGDRRLEAFVIDAPVHLEQGTQLLTSFLNGGAEWPNVIMPAFSGVMQIQATFNVRFYKWAMTGHSAASPVASDLVRIEYRLNGGAWQTARQFSGDNMPESVEGNYPLVASFNCRPVDVVEIRYSYHSDPNTKHAIVSYEFIDASDCEMPTNLKVETEKMTDKAVTLTWKDNNNPAAGSYLISYQKYVAPVVDEDGNPVTPAEDEDETWETLTVNATTAKLRNLAGGSTYTVQVQANCSSGESYPSSPVQVTAPVGLPYVENMTFGEEDMLTHTYAVKPNVSVYKGEPDEEWETADYLQSIETTPDSWNARYSETYIQQHTPDALAVSTAQDQAILVTPAIYIHPYVTPLPKTLTFRANTFDVAENENGVDLQDEDLRLYVLVSTSGTFAWNDTVASYDHNDLKTEATPGDIADRGQDFSINLEKFEGLVHIAFFFHNPNIVTESENNLPMFLEILNISLNYDGEVPCFPVDDLHTANIGATEATLIWDGEGEEYGITYYPNNDESQAKTVYQDATNTDFQTLKLENLKVTTNYTVEVVSYCTKGDRENGSIAASVKFRTLRELYAVQVNITPEDAGTVKGVNSYFEGFSVTLTATPNEGYKFVAWKDGETELSNEATYEFKMPAHNVVYTAVFTELELYSVRVNITPLQAGRVKGAGKHTEGEDVTLTVSAEKGYKFLAWMDGETELSKQTTYKFTMPSEDVTLTALFEETTANEDMVRTNFSVSTHNGQLMVRNLNGLMVKDVDIFGLTGIRINRFTPNSREDLTLPVDAERTLVFVRLHTENGTAVYKVYIN